MEVVIDLTGDPSDVVVERKEPGSIWILDVLELLSDFLYHYEILRLFRGTCYHIRQRARLLKPLHYGQTKQWTTTIPWKTSECCKLQTLYFKEVLPRDLSNAPAMNHPWQKVTFAAALQLKSTNWLPKHANHVNLLGSFRGERFSRTLSYQSMKASGRFLYALQLCFFPQLTSFRSTGCGYAPLCFRTSQFPVLQQLDMESSFIAEDPIDLPWNTLKVLTLNAASNESLNTRIQTTNGTPPPLERATLPHVIPGIGECIQLKFLELYADHLDHYPSTAYSLPNLQTLVVPFIITSSEQIRSLPTVSPTCIVDIDGCTVNLREELYAKYLQCPEFAPRVPPSPATTPQVHSQPPTIGAPRRVPGYRVPTVRSIEFELLDSDTEEDEE